MVTGVTVTERKTTSVTLMWNVDIQKEWTYFLYFQGKNVTFQANDFFSQELSGLQPGTEYTFSLVTHFFGLNSKAYEGFAVTSKKTLITVYLYSDYITRKKRVEGGETKLVCCYFLTHFRNRLFRSELACYRLLDPGRG